MSVERMRFRAAITVDFEADDFRAAGEQQDAIAAAFKHLRDQFSDASLTVAQRRFARRPQASALQAGRPRSGGIAAYDD